MFSHAHTGSVCVHSLWRAIGPLILGSCGVTNFFCVQAFDCPFIHVTFACARYLLAQKSSQDVVTNCVIRFCPADAPDSPQSGRRRRTVNVHSRVCPVSPRAPRKALSTRQPVSSSTVRLTRKLTQTMVLFHYVCRLAQMADFAQSPIQGRSATSSPASRMRRWRFFHSVTCNFSCFVVKNSFQDYHAEKRKINDNWVIAIMQNNGKQMITG